MKKKMMALACAAALLWGCGSVPLTGRRQLNLVSDQEVLASSLTQYSSYMKGAKKSGNAKLTEMVRRVGTKLAAATESYLKENGMAADVANFAWEFNLVVDESVNAFCMPGGKIVVYEGIMTIIDNENELAVVLGHEVAHAVAKHSNERMSQQVLAGYGKQVLGSVLQGQSAAVQAVAGSVYGIGAEYGVMMPFSRKHELEADYIGISLMALAGYNPDAAVAFWKKMSAMGGSSVPEFASTHPSDSRRIEELQKNLEKVKATYGAKAESPKAAAKK